MPFVSIRCVRRSSPMGVSVGICQAGAHGSGCCAASVARWPRDARRPRGVRRARGDARRAGRVRRLLHDRRGHVGLARLPGLRAADDERDGRQRGTDGGVDRHPAHRRCRYRLRQRAERHPHRARVREPWRRRPAHRGPGLAEAVRPPRRQGGHRHRRVHLQDPRRGRGPPRRPRAHRPHRRPADARLRRRRSNGPTPRWTPAPTSPSSRRPSRPTRPPPCRRWSMARAC